MLTLNMGKGSYIGGHTLIKLTKRKYGETKLEKIKEVKFKNFDEELQYFIRDCGIYKGKFNKYPRINKRIKDYLSKKKVSLEEFLNNNPTYVELYKKNRKYRNEEKEAIKNRKKNSRLLEKQIKRKKSQQRKSMGFNT